MKILNDQQFDHVLQARQGLHHALEELRKAGMDSEQDFIYKLFEASLQGQIKSIDEDLAEYVNRWKDQ